MRIGFTTVTFRDKSIEENIELAVRSGADGLEWGGDVHVPPGDRKTAENVRLQCEKNGLAVFSYGSYLSCKDRENVEAVMETAEALGAPLIRVWAYNKPPEEATEEEFRKTPGNLRSICREARARGRKIALEYHRGTLTQNSESAVRLIREVKEENLYCYWQPNPELQPEEHCKEIEMLLPYLANFHVFYWRREYGKDVRYPLYEAEALWESYIRTAFRRQPETDLILEFTKDNSERQFLEDMKTLRAIRSKLQ